MFKLVRWLFLLGIIAALGGFLVGKSIHGKTPAESFCKLIENPECTKLAAQGAADLSWARARWENASKAPAASKTAERESVPVKPARPAAPEMPPPQPSVQPPTSTGPPLDRHTVAERQALDRILTRRGSR